MKNRSLVAAALLAVLLAAPAVMLGAEQQSEMIAEKMAVKFTRGLANAVTCFIELPKQTVLTVRDMGGAGYIIGPLKGIGMTAYRGFVGAMEAAFFVVPKPGYYDPVIDPAYVWEGWEPKRDVPAEAEAKQE